jgi:YHS domain-containing protein
MSTEPETILDPVCGMTVTVIVAEASGLTVERDGRTYAFCRDGCKRAFESEPAVYIASTQTWPLRLTERTAEGRQTVGSPLSTMACAADTRAAHAA